MSAATALPSTGTARITVRREIAATAQCADAENGSGVAS